MPSASHSLQGSLLLAAPMMRDPHFARSVLFLSQHKAQIGAAGYVLNRPLDETVADLISTKGLGDLASVPVFMGGPVEPDKLAFVSMHWSQKEQSLRCETHLSVQEALHELAIGHDVRAFVGYSGWQKGQLERELKQRAWIVTAPQEQVLTVDEPKYLWKGVLSEMGPAYQLIGDIPLHPELN